MISCWLCLTSFFISSIIKLSSCISIENEPPQNSLKIHSTTGGSDGKEFACNAGDLGVANTLLSLAALLFISFCVCVPSYIWLFATLWTVARQASLSTEFSRQRTLEWVAIFFSRGSSWPRGRTWDSSISCISKRILYHCATSFHQCHENSNMILNEKNILHFVILPAERLQCPLLIHWQRKAK